MINILSKNGGEKMRYSSKWKMWKAILDFKICLNCRKNHGKIYEINEFVYPEPPLHPNCRCEIERLRVLLAGTATNDGIEGADLHLKLYGKLPSYYISKEVAEQLGYKSYLGNLSRVAPNKMLFKGFYENRDGHLPSAPGRIWYEADINYEVGYRGTERILFSNDGLIFVTYDHYHTFVEIE